MQKKEDISKAIIITGSAKRLGRVIAIEVARAGFEVIIHANNSQEDAIALQEEIIGLSLIHFYMCIRDSFNTCATILAFKFGKIVDIVIGCTRIKCKIA